MAELLVLWDVDYTLVSADGLGTRLTGSYPAADLAAAGAPVVLPDLTDTAGVVAAVTGPDLAGAAGRAGRARGR